MKQKQAALRKQKDQILLELRDLQKEVAEKLEKMDRATFVKTATDLVAPLTEKYRNEKVKPFLQDMFEDMAENLKIFSPPSAVQIPGMPPMMLEGDMFQPYGVNLFGQQSASKPADHY